MKRTEAGTIRAADIGQQVRVQAWVQRRRDHGGVLFLDLRDRSGIVQVVVHPDTAPEIAETLSRPEMVNSGLTPSGLGMIAPSQTIRLVNTSLPLFDLKT